MNRSNGGSGQAECQPMIEKDVTFRLTADLAEAV